MRTRPFGSSRQGATTRPLGLTLIALLALVLVPAPAALAGSDDFEFGQALARKGQETGEKVWFDYARRVPLWDTRHAPGFYTQLGEAQPLVAEVDDAVAIIGPGEEVELEFAALDQPPSARSRGTRTTLCRSGIPRARRRRGHRRFAPRNR